ncbi:hypothetical protein HW090_08665 [Pseudomonas sp. ABC1]|uniref:hypothetical protein n=1 Tax=Pseudomonas sp. ABC1 TaxID=2748080 RepID=UPI0015C2DAD1|nr:hypothetical protein [Pseudomonas sp. ABC1]QLF93261.1 hypothetical protein HW090_08665 [Pseudomonas sp. ABC1]
MKRVILASIANSGFLAASVFALLVTGSGLSYEAVQQASVERIQSPGAQSLQEPQAKRVPVNYQSSQSEQRWVF